MLIIFAFSPPHPRYPVPAPEKISVASPVPPVGTMDGADHCDAFDGSGVLCGSLADGARR